MLFPKGPGVAGCSVAFVNIPKARVNLYLRVLWLVRKLVVAPGGGKELGDAPSPRGLVVGVWPPIALFHPQIMQTPKFALWVEPLGLNFHGSVFLGRHDLNLLCLG